MIKSSEKTRRKLDENTDIKPSLKHYFNYKIAEPYIFKKNVLDVGCWSGQFEEFASKKTKKIVGIDPNNEAIESAKEKNPTGSFYVGSVEKLPFKNESFETVIFFDVIEHIPKRTEINSLKEIHRVLNYKGHLILSTPNKHIISIILDPAFFLIGHRHYSQKEVVDMLVKTGFQIERSFKVGGLFHLTSHLFELFLKHLFKKSFNYPNILKSRINREYNKGGFASLYVVAKKV